MSGSKHLMDIDGEEYLMQYVNLGQGPFFLSTYCCSILSILSHQYQLIYRDKVIQNNMLL